MFDNILKTKNSFKTIKTRTWKNQKTRIFSKGLVHGFREKCEIWPYFYFSQNKPKKGVWIYFKNKKCFQDYKNKNLKKSKTSNFSKGISPWFWSKMWNLAISFFSQKFHIFGLVFIFPKRGQKKCVWKYFGNKKMLLRQ